MKYSNTKKLIISLVKPGDFTDASYRSKLDGLTYNRKIFDLTEKATVVRSYMKESDEMTLHEMLEDFTKKDFLHVFKFIHETNSLNILLAKTTLINRFYKHLSNFVDDTIENYFNAFGDDENVEHLNVDCAERARDMRSGGL